MPLSAQALSSVALRDILRKTVLFITDSPQTLEKAHQDISTLSLTDNADLFYYPELEFRNYQTNNENTSNITGERITTLTKLTSNNKPIIITTCIQALMQKTFSPASLSKSIIKLQINHEIPEREIFSETLANSGYEFVTQVIRKEQVAWKGGLLDIWPPTEDLPIRIELFDSLIESLRTFNPATQISIEKISAIFIPPAKEPDPTKLSTNSSITSFINCDTIAVWAQEENIKEHALIYEKIITESDFSSSIMKFKKIKTDIKRNKNILEWFIGYTPHREKNLQHLNLDIQPVKDVAILPSNTAEPNLTREIQDAFITELYEAAQHGRNVVFLLDTAGSLTHFKDRTPKAHKGPKKLLPTTKQGVLSAGIQSDSMNFTIISEPDIYGSRKQRGRRYTPAKTNIPNTELSITDLTDIEPGDLVIHIEHGLGIYRGLFNVKFNGKLQEVLTIEYANQAKLHVPVSQAHLLTRYLGSNKERIKLHGIDNKRWQKDKENAEKSIQDLAASLLETQAQRDMLQGFPFSPDTKWQYEFEASFPFVETVDQQKVIAAVKKDMESSKPMDRLICGDAGYGKTEIAMRAAFKCVMNGKQVAILVPTTILAQQHYETFSQRMAPYPIRIERLSRFCSKSLENKIKEKMTDGEVDIVIGTHALVQPHVSFKNLGLVIIDEEQRFGVTHKEHLKQLRQLVDVITMTATPIPRTLYMSMTGTRDMSLLQSPPSERTAIETIVVRNNDKVIRDAVLREKNRGGQVFYLHNRVMTIERIKTHLQNLIPEASITIAHGRMATGELSKVMQNFVNGVFDVLLCTTIIESGMDIPTANTIIIDRADRFGIADIYQLRGRVGRSKNKAYAYLLLPQHGRINRDARKRIDAVKKYSSLSAGFNLALKDLEMRGAGNILGAEQSGHIAAIGFNLYCQLLKRSIAIMQGIDPPPIINVALTLDFINLSPGLSSKEESATLPYSYIEDEALRISIYKKIAEASSTQEIKNINKELTDRFGREPVQVSNLLKMALIRIIAAQQKIDMIEVQNQKIMMRSNGSFIKNGIYFPRLKQTHPPEQLEELMILIQEAKWQTLT